MIKLDRITHKVTIAINLVDELPGKEVTGNVYLKALQYRGEPILHSSGYYFLLDAPQKLKVVAGGDNYIEEIIDINTDDYQPVLTTGSKPENPKIRVAEIKLKRK